MWIYMKDGFVSVVKHQDKPDMLLVRARIKGDIEKLWPGAKVAVNAGTDYKYRAEIHHADVAGVIYDAVNNIDYDNFKNSILDKRRSAYYSMVWDTMWTMQDELNKD